MQALVGDPRGGPDTAPTQARGTGIRYSGGKTCLRLGYKCGSFGHRLEGSLVMSGSSCLNFGRGLCSVGVRFEQTQRLMHRGGRAGQGPDRPRADGRCPARRQSHPGRT